MDKVLLLLILTFVSAVEIVFHPNREAVQCVKNPECLANKVVVENGHVVYLVLLSQSQVQLDILTTWVVLVVFDVRQLIK